MKSVGVIGGGTAGWFAALAIKQRYPDVAVTVVESSAVPIIGVGEATTTLMPPFLHAQLGLSPVELFERVGVTFKLGIKFEWGPAGEYFTYPFGAADPLEAFAHDGHLRDQSLVSMLMANDASLLLRGPDGELLSLLPRLKFAYHLDNAPFVAFLAAAAKRAGIEHVDMTIDAAIPYENGIAAVRSADGRELRFDFFIDASGFHSLLVEKTLGSPFTSYASSLFCDRAIAAQVPQGEAMQPYTTAETMESGWCWRIPVRGEDHRGYVFSSAFVSEDEAEAEMRRKNPGMRNAWTVKFRSGRHRDFLVGNVAAVGNAYGFVEPLESTALHMVIVEIGYLLASLDAMRTHANVESAVTRANESVGAHWDYLRWFLAAHYKFNQRLDTPFWRAARADVDVSGIADLLERFTHRGPFLALDTAFRANDPAFGYSGLMMMLLGQRVPTVTYTTQLSRKAWETRTDKERAVADRALPHAEALKILGERPELLRALTENPASWVRGDAERMIVGETARPRGGR